MSLQVWLPLNGNLKNQGLADVTVTNNGATVDNAGKIGQCYSFDGTDDYMAVPNLSMKNTMTFALWYNPSVASNGTIPGGYHHIFDARKSGVTNGQEVLLLQSPNVRAWGVNCSYVLPANTWSHICIINNNGAVSIYVNGDLKTTGTTTMTTEYETTLYIGTRFSVINMMAEKMNDIRIYDHCLSPKEVSEIAKGLVLHYKLDDPEILKSKYSTITWNQLYYDGYFNSKSGYTDYSYNSSTDTITFTNSELNKWTVFCRRVVDTCVVGHKYFVRCDVKSSITHTSPSESFRVTYVNQGSTSSFINKLLEKDIWTHFAGIHTNASGYGYGFEVKPISNIGTYNVRNYQVFDLTQMFGAGNEPTVEEFEMMFPLPYYPYNAGTQMTLDYKTVYDCSGYNNNGTITGSLSANSNTPRYEYSTLFNGTDSNIVASFPCYDVYNTFVCWAKFSKFPVFVLDCRTSGVGYQPMYVERTKIQIGRASNYVNFSYTFVTDTWYHIAVVQDNSKGFVYINGQKIGESAAAAGYNFGQNLTIHIGSRFTNELWLEGGISDFRIYTTALSEQDIKDLYNTSAYVDNGQNLHCFEFVEDDFVAPEITKMGIVKTQEFIENAETELYEDKIEANQLIEQ